MVTVSERTINRQLEYIFVAKPALLIRQNSSISTKLPMVNSFLDCVTFYGLVCFIRKQSKYLLQEVILSLSWTSMRVCHITRLQAKLHINA